MQCPLVFPAVSKITVVWLSASSAIYEGYIKNITNQSSVVRGRRCQICEQFFSPYFMLDHQLVPRQGHLSTKLNFEQFLIILNGEKSYNYCFKIWKKAGQHGLPESKLSNFL